MPSEVRLVFDGAVLQELLHGPSGMVNNFMMTRSEVVRLAAMQDANYKTGALRKSIVKRAEYAGTELSIRISAGGANDVTYAYYVHEGWKEHPITAKNKPYLVFFWPNAPGGARWHKAKSVWNKGYAGNPFLTRNLPLFFAV